MIYNWQYVVVHHSASKDDIGLQFDNERDFHKLIKEWRDIGYHFLNEDVDGEALNIVGRPLTMKGAHCPPVNHIGIGFCFIGNFEKQPGPSDIRILEAVHRVIIPLMVYHKIPLENVIKHSDRSATACPGRYFRWDKLIAEIKNGL